MIRSIAMSNHDILIETVHDEAPHAVLKFTIPSRRVPEALDLIFDGRGGAFTAFLVEQFLVEWNNVSDHNGTVLPATKENYFRHFSPVAQADVMGQLMKSWAIEQMQPVIDGLKRQEREEDEAAPGPVASPPPPEE